MKDIIREDKKYGLKRPITGNISKDRIWEQWYNPSVFEEQLPKMNQRDYLFDVCNQDYKDQMILNNRGLKRITIRELESLCNRFVLSLRANGIGVGDVVTSIALSTPELIALKYASATVGAISANLNFMDANGKYSDNKLFKQLKLLNPSIIFTLDILENKVSEVVNSSEFSSAKKVRLPLVRSTPLFNAERAKILLLDGVNYITGKGIKNTVSLNHFMREGDQYTGSIESVYQEGMPANIAFTSATTGESKAILLSHDANNALAMQHKLADLGLERGNTNLALVPPFLAIWDADIIHMAMCLGIENILELSLTYDNIPKYLEKYLPNYGIWSQYLWDSLLTVEPEKRQEITTHILKAVVGGERAEANQVDSFYELTGVLQAAGYGSSEIDSCFSVAHPNCNICGSAGLPLPFNNVRIVDTSGNDLTYNQPGRILLTGPGLMEGYYKRPDLTARVLRRDSQGTLWYDSEDYGYVDITGSIVPLDRDKKPIQLTNGNLVKTIDISEKIKECSEVKICKTNEYQGVLVTHVVLDNYSMCSEEEQLERILSTAQENLDIFEQPHILNVIDSLPRTQVGKVDYPKLQTITEDLVLQNVDSIDTNHRLMIINNLESKEKSLGKHI